MWYKYFIIAIYSEKVKIGFKLNPDTGVGVIGGPRRYSNFMYKIIEDYFNISSKEVKVIFPQTYKIKLTFKFSPEAEKEFRILMKSQREFVLLETSSLGRTIR